MNNKILLIILVVLVGIYALTQLFSGNSDRTFDPNLLQIDSTQINRIEVDLLEGEDYFLEKENGVWMAHKETFTVEALPNVVEGILGQMQDIKILRITTKDKAKWPNFEIAEGQAKAKITFKNDSNNLGEIVIGGFRFNQQARSALSFIRTTDGDEVYAIDGFSSRSLGQTFDSFRDKKVLQLDRDAISGVDIKTATGNFGFQKTIAGWVDAEGTALDSTKVMTYLQTLANYRAQGFNDSFKRSGDFQNTISIQTAAQPIPVQIHIDKVEGAAQPFALECTATTQRNICRRFHQSLE